MSWAQKPQSRHQRGGHSIGGAGLRRDSAERWTPAIGYRREWAPAVEAAGGPSFHFHDLRHYSASRLDEQGMSGKLRTEVIGHANESITNSVYTHVKRERIAAAADAFDPLAA